MFGSQRVDPARGIEDLRGLGVGRIMLPAFFFAGPDGLDRLSAIAEKHIKRGA